MTVGKCIFIQLAYYTIRLVDLNDILECYPMTAVHINNQKLSFVRYCYIYITY